jgi:predicted homoserine dehydrogenase-like protein
MILYDELQSIGRHIRVGLVGAGFMGRGIVEIFESTPGMEVVVVADIEIERAAACFEDIGFTQYSQIARAGEAQGTRFPGQRVITSNSSILPEIEGLDFIIEATGVPEVGAEVAYHSIRQGKHVGMLNVETDVTVGHYLSTLAKNHGVVYTVCTGDEPAAIRELVDFAKTLGFDLVACGKGKNNPLDVSATPELLAGTAREKGLNPRILTEFVDGSKTMVEMCCVANAERLTIDRRNMHGPHANLDELSRIFSTKQQGGILSQEGVVDYAIGDVAPGVFVVVRHEGRLVNRTLRYLKIGEGPNYVLYRPFHLTDIEVPISVAVGFLYKKPCLATASPPTTEVITIAKRDLHSGEFIDHIGGTTVYGGIETSERAAAQNLVPFGLCEGAQVKEDVKTGTPIAFSQMELKKSFLYELRRLQDRLYD